MPDQESGIFDDYKGLPVNGIDRDASESPLPELQPTEARAKEEEAKYWANEEAFEKTLEVDKKSGGVSNRAAEEYQRGDL